MMRSMYSGVSGLRVHQTKMDVIGNNIANVNTIGFKSQRVNFNEVFSQTLESATSANDATGRGGRNPMQVGLGVNVSSIDTLMTQGAAQRTDNPFDLMINGEGFIVVGDSSGQYFTRAGALRLDDSGNLVIPNGMKVQGWPATTDGKDIQKGQVGDISMGGNTTEPAKTTSSIEISGNVDSREEEATIQLKFYDSVGNMYTSTMKLQKDKVVGADDKAQTKWNMVPQLVNEKGESQKTGGTHIKLTDSTGKMFLFDATKTPIIPSDQSLFFDKNGKLVGTAVNTTNAPLEKPTDPTAPPLKTNFEIKNEIDLSKAAIIMDKDGNTENKDKIKYTAPNATIGAKDSNGVYVNVKLSSLTQFASKTNVTPTDNNGYPAGNIMGFDVAGDGKISAYYDNGATRLMGQIVVANFENPAGLEKVGDNLFKTTANSGDFDNVGSDGNFQAGVLEMSNVDLSREFTEMITTQRGFQANSRIISVSDEMLQELVNLKR
ncbi:MAG: flagellar hook protein FlgE [Cellulosilyticaceae bacterium]